MSNTASFKAFLERWESKQGELLGELTAARMQDGREEEEKMRELITRALTQYEEYYEEKSRAVKGHVFQMFSPEWCSPLERAFYWISGFRPTAMFRLVAAVDDLSPDQILFLDRLKSETKWQEKALSDEQARIQETVAAPPVAGALQRVGWRPHSVQVRGQHPDVALRTVQDATEALVANADGLRGRTAAGMVEILTMKQSIRVLESVLSLQRNMKIWGMGRQTNI
ncbi:hypothetical protein V2J09_012016 [Rumex salicifolius]